MVATTRGGNKLANGVGAECAHGVDLFGHLHGSEFRGHTGGVAAGNHQSGKHRAELLDHRKRDEVAGHAYGAEGLERGGGLQRKHAAGKKAREHDDGQGSEADRIHLGKDVGPIAGRGEEIGKGASGQNGIVLDGANSLFDEDLWGHEWHQCMWLRLSDAGTWRRTAKIQRQPGTPAIGESTGR